MEIIQGVYEFKSDKPTVLTIGTFDGVHIGHQQILKHLIETAKANDLYSCLLTFYPHPRMVLQKDSGIKMIQSIEEKIEKLREIGLDYLVIHPFSKEFSRLTAQTYIEDILVKKLQTKKIIIGYDHRFGKNRAADINDLRAYAKEFDFEVIEISAQAIEEITVSSTKIRTALIDGHIEEANRFLGYEFHFSGTVVKGKALGKQIGFPTANLKLKNPFKLIPKNGVYAVRVLVEEKWYDGMMNIGVNPTILESDLSKLKIEIHLFNFNRDIYEKQVRVSLSKFIRDEHKFESVEALKQQIITDQQQIQFHFDTY